MKPNEIYLDIKTKQIVVVNMAITSELLGLFIADTEDGDAIKFVWPDYSRFIYIGDL